ncbi:MAG: hypothetical protein ACPIOQ_27040, partial [Promethearchaeia archaeon]
SLPGLCANHARMDKGDRERKEIKISTRKVEEIIICTDNLNNSMISLFYYDKIHPHPTLPWTSVRRATSAAQGLRRHFFVEAISGVAGRGGWSHRGRRTLHGLGMKAPGVALCTA